MARGNVLVVEDDDAIRRLLTEYLEQHSGLSVEGARDGVEALHLISTKPFAVIVLDLIMPKMSGIDFLDSLNALISDPSVKSIEQPPEVVVITATPDTEVPTQTIESRCALVREVFRKPLDVMALTETVERYLW